jgi:hypothetical protein
VLGAAVVVLLVVIAARIAIDRRAAARRARLSMKARAADRSRDLWTESRALANAGRFEDATHAIYGAILEALTSANLIRYHRSKTAGDYARELRRAGSPLAPEFGAFGRDFDRLAFGRVAVSREEYEHLVLLAERITPFGRRASAA